MKIQKRLSLATVTLLSIVLQSACTGLPEGTQVVTGFKLDRYLGKWYEIARLDHSFERGLIHVTADYSLREDGGVKVVNRGYEVAENAWSEAEGKAFFIGATDEGRLKVSFFGPFYGAYNIIELDKDAYQYAMIAGPDRDYLWILSRTPQLDPATLTRLVEKAASLNFSTDELIYVDHSSQTLDVKPGT